MATRPAAIHPLRIALGASTVSGLLSTPATDPRAVCVLAHGAGAGMEHRFLASLAGDLVERGVAVLRFQFPFMEQGSRRPDRPAVAIDAVRAAITAAATAFPGRPIVAAGKSFGGRMTSQAQAAAPLPGVVGLAFVGFPLHPEGRPGVERAAHLAEVAVPMLFLQGTRDALADPALLEPMVAALGERATLRFFDDADHAFHVRRKSGSDDDSVRRALADTLVAWAANLASRS